jgi:hypothetical protein
MPIPAKSRTPRRPLRRSTGERLVSARPEGSRAMAPGLRLVSGSRELHDAPIASRNPRDAVRRSPGNRSVGVPAATPSTAPL